MRVELFPQILPKNLLRNIRNGEAAMQRSSLKVELAVLRRAASASPARSQP
jgi:hypothetical protein